VNRLSNFKAHTRCLETKGSGSQSDIEDESLRSFGQEWLASSVKTFRKFWVAVLVVFERVVIALESTMWSWLALGLYFLQTELLGVPIRSWYSLIASETR
jgi:hypothetical protein